MIKEYLHHIFFFAEDQAGMGMSEQFFFTHIYFWFFFAFVLIGYTLIEEGSKLLRYSFAVVITGILGWFLLELPDLKFHFAAWSLFAMVLIVYTVKDKRLSGRNAFLFLLSLFFYYKTSGFFFLILVFSTLVDYSIGMGIHHSENTFLRKVLVVTSVTINLLVLCYFKYAYFFTDAYNQFATTLNEMINTTLRTDIEVENFLANWANDTLGGGFTVDRILLPVGISFYTFQTISYSVDIYRRQLKPVYNILDFGFYVSFFPQLVAGPIVRASEFIPQLYKPFQLSKKEFGMALFLILNGLLKKAFLADFIANGFIDGVFEDPLRYTSFENYMALFGYSLQVYADFSGYTDIAIGLALLMGFRLNTNFNSPYKAMHVGDFWRRWHISLSTWLRDYLYIPLGGNRKGTVASYVCISLIILVCALLAGEAWPLVLVPSVSLVLIFTILALTLPGFRSWLNTNINLMITMLFGGLWHGSSWNFVIWGGLNGLGLVVYKLWKKISPWEGKTFFLIRPWRILLTLIFITATRIFFRAPDMTIANHMMDQLQTATPFSVMGAVIEGLWFYYLVMIVGYVIHWLPTDFKTKYQNFFIESHWAVKVAAVIFVVYLSYQSFQAAQPFIYFQF